MKYHKIPKIEKSICTAEAVIAYNIAHLERDIIKKAYEKCTCNFQKADIIREGVKICMQRVFTNDNIKSKYDIDAIFSCLNAGLENYINAKYSIITDYEEIGKMFPSYYL